MRHFLGSLVMLIVGIAGFQHAYADVPADADYPFGKPQAGVRIYLLRRVKSDEYRFRVENNGKRAITLSSLFGKDSKYPFAPLPFGIEHLENHRWIKHQIGHDSIPDQYVLKAGKQVEFSTNLTDWFDDLPKGTLIRFKIDGYYCKPFRDVPVTSPDARLAPPR
jgi:hypothetical protein